MACLRSRERLVEFRRVTAAGLRDVVAPAAATADDLRRLPDHVRRGEPALDDVIAEAGYERDLAVVRRRRARRRPRLRVT